MNEEEKEAIKVLNNINLLYCGKEDERAIETILNLVEKQQKEIKARLKEIDSLYKMMSVKDDEIEKLKSRKYIFNAETNEIKEIPISDDYIHKDKLKEIIEKHKKFLSNESSNYDEDDIENRKAIQYALARLSFLLTDILKED